ncbi:hypothetical protein CRUP_002495, partial [Coryphaenoides rupestris]
HLGEDSVALWNTMALPPMMDHFPPALLEACVVLGASYDKLKDLYQVLHILVPPFFGGDPAQCDAGRSLGQRRRLFLRKKKERAPQAAAAESASSGGLQVTNELKEEQFHFLVFTDVFGNRTHGVVMQYYRLIMEGTPVYQNGHGSFNSTRLYAAYGFCLISKYPYYTALKDCMSCLLVQLRTCRLSDMEERVKEFTAKLALVPIPPPGPLHVMFSLHPLNIVLPSREQKDCPTVDLDLHIPLLCFRPPQLLQEQRVVLFSADWARLTLVAESLLLFLKPMSWQQPYVPVLARGMLDFLMAPTAFLMGCHSSHFEEVAAETDDLILINIDAGSVSTSQCENVGLPGIPAASAECFTESCLDINEQRAQKRAWQSSLNADIQRVALELIVNIFRSVWNKVLETHIFHFFLKDRLNRKMDAFARMEVHTRSEMQKSVLRLPLSLYALRTPKLERRGMQELIF